MPENDYIAMWSQLGKACIPDDQNASPSSSQETFWMKVEGAINKMLHTFVVESLLAGFGGNKKLETVRVVFYDDKMHFAAARSSATALLKVSQHVWDNRKGHVCHHAVLTATNLLIGFRLEREGDATESCTRSIVKSQLASAQGGDQSTVKNLGWLEAIAIEGISSRSCSLTSFFRQVQGLMALRSALVTTPSLMVLALKRMTHEETSL